VGHWIAPRSLVLIRRSSADLTLWNTARNGRTGSVFHAENLATVEGSSNSSELLRQSVCWDSGIRFGRSAAVRATRSSILLTS
jgi:hypothetical protein